MTLLSRKVIFFRPDYAEQIILCFNMNNFNNFSGTALKLECSFYNLNYNYHFFNINWDKNPRKGEIFMSFDFYFFPHWFKPRGTFQIVIIL